MTSNLHQSNVRKLIAAGLAAACLTLSACDSAELTCSIDCEVEADVDGDGTGTGTGTDTAASNLIDLATEAGTFTTLLAAIESADLQQVLADPANTFTVFAPTDDAFAAVDEAALTALLADGTALTDTLLYHVLPGAVDAETATSLAGTSITMENSKAAALTLVDGVLKINSANITTTDLVASNGLIHVIDAVLTPPVETVQVNLIETARNAGNFSTLISALETSGLDQVLANEQQTFTVFAPTDDAFAALGSGALDGLIADSAALNDTLLYHVLPGAVNAETATGLAGTSITMQNGADATLSLSGEQLMINTSNITVTDIMATNGIIHVIDTVLATPDSTAPVLNDLVATLANKPNYSALLGLLQSSGLAETLADPTQTFTIFAPTNEAILAADAELQADFATDAAALQSLLEGHVLPDSVVEATTALTLDGTDITMANGVVRTITVSDSTVKLDTATVVETDITAANGIIHGIDTVLLP